MRWSTDTPTSIRANVSTVQILLLEDDLNDCKLIEAILAKGGISAEFTHARNRQDFLKCLSQHPPDLILADYVLPSFDGIEALALTKRMHLDIPFILVSGVLGEEAAIAAIKQGATDYVLKQRLGRLVPAIHRALEEHQERQERQRVAAELRETDNLLHAVVDASPIGIITLDLEQRVVTWNAAAETIYGWSESAVRGRPFPILPDSGRSLLAHYLAEAVEHNRTATNLEGWHRTQDGDWVDVSLSIAPLHNANGDSYGVLITVIDISDRKQIEVQQLNLLQQQSAARAAAESANRTKDEFLAVLSHELQTPLNAILGCIELMQRGNLEPTVLQHALDVIERNVISETQMVQNLLDFSHNSQGQLSLSVRSAEVAAVIQATVNSLRPAAQAKAIALQVELPTAPLSIAADPDRLQQICWNLLSNAIKFTPVGGTVTIGAALIDRQLRIQVIDTGEGISPVSLPHVFEHFRQADGSSTRPDGGMGLGLAITRDLVELHGGTIWVDSLGLGQGAIFTVEIPVPSTVENRSSTQSSASADALTLADSRVLVIEDDEDSRKLMVTVLEMQGAQVQQAAQVAAARERLQRFQPDVIVSDISMPGQNGYSFMEELRSHADPKLSGIPAISVTAHASREDRQQALAAGFQAHLAKPFELDDLVDAVIALLP